MNKKFKITILASFFLINLASGQKVDSVLINKNIPFAFGKGQLFLSPGLGFAKGATSYGAGLEYGLTNVVGLSVGISNAMFNKNSFAGYGSVKTVRASAVSLSLKLHTGFQKKQKMFDVAPEISFSKLLGDTDFIIYPKVGIGAGLDMRIFVSKVVAFNFAVAKALNGAKKWGVGGGLTFRIKNK